MYSVRFIKSKNGWCVVHQITPNHHRRHVEGPLTKEQADKRCKAYQQGSLKEED